MALQQYKRQPTIKERLEVLEEHLNDILLMDGACTEIEETCRQIHILRWRRKYENDLIRKSLQA